MLILIKNATILSPTSKHHRKKKDILIEDGIIISIQTAIKVKADKVIEGKNILASDGFVDTFSNFCEPGFEHKEDLLSGTLSAMRGGYTDVFLIPNTKPSLSSKTTVEFVKNTQYIVNLHPIGSISKNIEGKDLAEMQDMHESGAIAFSDGLQPIQHSGLLLKALQYVKAFDSIIIQLPEDKNIAPYGLMNEGETSVQLGLQGKPTIAEQVMVARDIELVNYTKSKLHFTGITCNESLQLIKKAKKDNPNISCSVSPFHLMYTDEELKTYNSLYKFSNPLRTEKDRKQLLKALEDGTIDCVASHHLPQDSDAKEVEFEYAQEGCISLQTCFSMLVKLGVSTDTIVHILSTRARQLFNLPSTIEENQSACITLFTMEGETTFTEQTLKSKSKNTPLLNATLPGKIIGILNNHQSFFNG
jgi:dihydroorotase